MSKRHKAVEAREPGKDITRSALAAFLRSGKSPQNILDFAADVIEGKAKLKRGRPRVEDPVKIFKRLARDIEIWTIYAEIYEQNSSTRSRSGTPTERTLAETRQRLAKRNIFVSEGTIRSVLYDFFLIGTERGSSWPDE